MQFKFATLVAAAVLVAPALAENVNYEGFSSAVECIGASFGCTDGGALCCSLPTGFGFSAQFNDLPTGTQGQGYTDGKCTAFTFQVFGPGTKCFNGGGTRAASLNWFHSAIGRRDAVQARKLADSEKECVSPAYFKYQVSGADRVIKVPSGEAQTIADLYLANNLTALAVYEEY